jgi:hypothetical protein
MIETRRGLASVAEGHGDARDNRAPFLSRTRSRALEASPENTMHLEIRFHRAVIYHRNEKSLNIRASSGARADARPSFLVYDALNLNGGVAGK